MDAKTPVILVVLIDSARLRWLVASLGLDGELVPLVRSEEGDLSAYQGQPFDEQVSFLRHRLCGVVQRGCDRLWPVGKKACQFAILFDGNLPETTEELTRAVSEHFAMWMLNPPVAVFGCSLSTSNLGLIAGTITPEREQVVQGALAPLFLTATDPDVWELSQRKGTWRPSSAPSEN